MSPYGNKRAGALMADLRSAESNTLDLIMDVPLTGSIQTQTQNHNWRRPSVVLFSSPCGNPACRNIVAASRRERARGRGRFCSRSCSSKVRVGESNPCFRGWVSRNKRAYVNRFRTKYPEKARAHDAVKNALRNGTLVRPTACEDCAAACHPGSHHEDYSKPLDVVFVCRPCHRIRDAARQQRSAAA